MRTHWKYVLNIWGFYVGIEQLDNCFRTGRKNPSSHGHWRDISNVLYTWLTTLFMYLYFHLSPFSGLDMIFWYLQVQAEWSRIDVLGYNVIIDIKKLVLWETNPVNSFRLSSSIDSTTSNQSAYWNPLMLSHLWMFLLHYL